MMTQEEKSRGGRPRKFSEKTMPVTMRLPVSAVQRLARIDADRTRAVVKALDVALGEDPSGSFVRKLPISADEALIIVPDCPHLRRIPWLRFIEIAPGKNLLSVQKGVPIEKFEVTLGDVLDSAEGLGDDERATLRSLLECIRTPRRNQAMRTEEILLVGVHSSGAGKGGTRAAAGHRRAP